MISRRNFTKTSLAAAAALATRSALAASFGITPVPSRPEMPQPGLPQPLRFGVNYVPRRRWWYCWLDWDQSAILEDLEGIAGLGLDHIRIQCLWPLFQPGIASVSERALANLHSLLDAADKAGLDVEVTVLNGWMSGLAFLPAWVSPLAEMVSDRKANIFTTPKIIEAEKLLLSRIAETVGRHPRFLGFDLGNELGVLQNAKSNPVTPSEADSWATGMLRYCEEIAPGKFHVNGVDDSHWFNDTGFSRPCLANTGSATVVHSYIYFTGVLERYKYSDPAALHLADYMIELACAYQSDFSLEQGRRVWVEEIGVGNKEMPESYKPEFLEHSVRNIAATGKVWGITWWASHDIDPAIRDFDSYEYGLGLLDLQNKPKPMGRKFAELAAELRRSPAPILPRKTALVIPDQGLSNQHWPPDWRFAKPYMDLIAQGETPAIVLESRIKDRAYLATRGIESLVQGRVPARV